MYINIPVSIYIYHSICVFFCGPGVEPVTRRPGSTGIASTGTGTGYVAFELAHEVRVGYSLDRCNCWPQCDIVLLPVVCFVLWDTSNYWNRISSIRYRYRYHNRKKLNHILLWSVWKSWNHRWKICPKYCMQSKFMNKLICTTS